MVMLTRYSSYTSGSASSSEKPTDSGIADCIEIGDLCARFTSTLQLATCELDEVNRIEKDLASSNKRKCTI